MLSHDSIWKAIDALAAREDLSPSGLARLAGLDPTTFNPSKRFLADGRPRWPSTQSIAKILMATQSSPALFFSQSCADNSSLPAHLLDVALDCYLREQVHSSGRSWPVGATTRIVDEEEMDLPALGHLPPPPFGASRWMHDVHDVSELETKASGARDTSTDPSNTGPSNTGPDNTGPDNTGPDNTGPDNTGQSGKERYRTASYPVVHALVVSDDSLRPFYRVGNWLLVATHMPLEPGARILFRADDTSLHIADIHTGSSGGVVLEDLVARNCLEGPDALRGKWVARILWASQ